MNFRIVGMWYKIYLFSASVANGEGEYDLYDICLSNGGACSNCFLRHSTIYECKTEEKKKL